MRERELPPNARQYKQKCNQLEDEITVLRSAIYQLSLMPQAIHVGMDVDKKRHALQAYIKENKDGKKIKRSVESFVHALSSSQKKNQDLSPNLNDFLDRRIDLLLKQIYLPEEITVQLNSLQSHLKQRITSDALPQLLDSLTELIIQAFQLEHNQFSDFMMMSTHAMHELTSYLELLYQQNLQSEQNTSQLEHAIKKMIANHNTKLESAESLEDIEEHLSHNLQYLQKQLQLYRKSEHNRVRLDNEKILKLQQQIANIEYGAEKMKNHLSAHQINVNQDPLTGLANQTAYHEYVLGAYHRWQRGFGETTLALADLDHFTDINDNYGHQVGDEILKKIADLFKSSIRAADFIARFQGESFLFIFERTSAFASAKVLESLRAAVEENEIFHQDLRIKLTVSFGVTSFKHGDTLEKIFERAHNALDEAKQTGRNRLVIL